mmetsp:Transcript_33659/g.72580  ORF Transcript_33659/g.72580 Transcript_33659/m.72580 type:complete len:270 (+) Transcript_33659:257-1066(+)
MDTPAAALMAASAWPPLPMRYATHFCSMTSVPVGRSGGPLGICPVDRMASKPACSTCCARKTAAASASGVASGIPKRFTGTGAAPPPGAAGTGSIGAAAPGGRAGLDGAAWAVKDEGAGAGGASSLSQPPLPRLRFLLGVLLRLLRRGLFRLSSCAKCLCGSGGPSCGICSCTVGSGSQSLTGGFICGFKGSGCQVLPCPPSPDSKPTGRRSFGSGCMCGAAAFAVAASRAASRDVSATLPAAIANAAAAALAAALRAATLAGSSGGAC